MRGSKSSKDGTSDDSRSVLPPVKPTYLSSIDRSTSARDGHRMAAQRHGGDAQGCDRERRRRVGHQFLTISGDGHLMIWDLRFKEIAKKKAAMSRSDSKADKDGEVEWNPHFSLLLTKLNGVGELALRKISISNDPSTAFIVTTEEGEIVDADWRPGGGREKGRRWQQGVRRGWGFIGRAGQCVPSIRITFGPAFLSIGHPFQGHLPLRG